MAIDNEDLLYVWDSSESKGKKTKYETLKKGTGGTGEFGYWTRTGTNLSPVNAGDSVKITGAAGVYATSRITVGDDNAGESGVADGVRFKNTGQSFFSGPGALRLLSLYQTGNSTPTTTLNADGSATFAGKVTSASTASTDAGTTLVTKDYLTGGAGSIGSGALGYWSRTGTTLSPVNSGDIVQVGGLYTDPTKQGSYISNLGCVAVRRDGTNVVFQGNQVGNSSPTFEVKADGSATFAGDVVIGSRGSKWMIVESGGLAHLVKQTSLKDQPDSYPELRNLPNELTMVEQCLQEVMEKLKMIPPAGWPVWDGTP